MISIPNLTKIRDVCAPELRRPVPDCWEETEHGLPLPGRMWWDRKAGLKVMLSTDVMQDGSRWLHVSVSRRDRLPRWDDLKRAKDEFIGRNREAVQVLPPDREFVNCHPFCLHLWSPEQ